MFSFQQIKPKIKNLGSYKTIAEIKRDGLRVAYNRANDSYWLIERRFLQPVIKSPRECKSILIKPEELKYKIFMCRKDREELRGAFALRYIEWGESRGFDKAPTVQNRKYWWQNPDFVSKVFMQMSYNDVFKFWYARDEIRCDARLYTISLQDEQDVYLLNSTLSALFIELLGRANLGEGALDFKVYEADDILVLGKEKIHLMIDKKIFSRSIKSIFTECGIDQESKTSIEEQIPKPLPDLRALDKIVFDALGLTEAERAEVYRAVCRLVWNRISKARSV